jgi:hypothetical protein
MSGKNGKLGYLVPAESRGRRMIQQKLNLYRLHFIDRKTGTIAHTYEFFAENEAEGLKFAEVWAEDAPMELWGRKRLKHWEGSSRNP